MSDEFIGVVGGVYALDLGDKLSQAAVIGDTVLHVYDVADFADEGGFLRLNGTILEYIGMDDDASTLTLDVALTAAAGVDTVVEVWDSANGTNATIYKAVIDQLDGFDGQAVEAVIDQSIAHALADTMRGNETGESVSLERVDGELRVTTVHGRAFALASQQLLQGGMTTRQEEDAAGVDIFGEDADNPGITLYGPDGSRIVIQPGLGNATITFYTGSGIAQDPSLLFIGNDGTTDNLTLVGPTTTVNPIPAQMIQTPGSSRGVTKFFGDVKSADGDVNAFGSLITQNPQSTTNAANARINSTGGGDIRLSSTSLQRFKLDPNEVTYDDVAGLLEVVPQTWFDKGEVAENGDSTEGLYRIPGAFAEHVAEHAPILSTYNENGELQGIAYERIAPLLIPILRRHHDELAEVRAENADLRSRVERLEAHLLGKDTA